MRQPCARARSFHLPPSSRDDRACAVRARGGGTADRAGNFHQARLNRSPLQSRRNSSRARRYLRRLPRRGRLGPPDAALAYRAAASLNAVSWRPIRIAPMCCASSAGARKRLPDHRAQARFGRTLFQPRQYLEGGEQAGRTRRGLPADARATAEPRRMRTWARRSKISAGLRRRSIATAPLHHKRRLICDLDGLEAEENELRALMAAAGSEPVHPFAVLSMGLSAAGQWHASRSFAASFAAPAIDHRREEFAGARKLRIGYLSADFCRHPTALLIAELFERHDKSCFEIVAYSHGPDDRSEVGARLREAFDDCVDIRAMADAEAARRIRAETCR
jgi:hypothetical protein